MHRAPEEKALPAPVMRNVDSDPGFALASQGRLKSPHKPQTRRAAVRTTAVFRQDRGVLSKNPDTGGHAREVWTFQAISFGDFSFGQKRKVTRPPQADG